jgi:hypothetical protein
MSKEDQRVNPYPVRLSRETKQKLEAIAKANGRSLNAQIVMMLESVLQAEERPPVPDLAESRIRELIREELTKAGK